MSLPLDRTSQDVLGLAFELAYENVAGAVRSLGVSRMIYLSSTDPELFAALTTVLDLLGLHRDGSQVAK